MLDDILSRIPEKKTLKQQLKEKKEKSSDLQDLYSLIQDENYVGEVVEMHYSESIVQISDYHRQKVGGIPSQAFIVATRINPKAPKLPDIEGLEEHDKEDCSVVLLRVLDSAELPSDMDRRRIRAETAELSNEDNGHWEEKLDASSKRLMSFSGMRCRVIGTFYLQKTDGKLKLCFGSDVSNYYPSRGLKVYKPTNEALQSIVNFGINMETSIKIGNVRYASTQRINQGVDLVPVKIDPKDLVAQKTAVFGMTRTGKSNTVKTIVKAIYQMRFALDNPQVIGQIIFDPNGEYANENLQDKDDITGEATAIKSLWKIPVNQKIGSADDIQIYSLGEHKNDPKRTIMKINFYDDKLIDIGKELIDNKLETDGSSSSSMYMKNFINVRFERPETGDQSASTRYERKLLVYKTLLSKSDFTPPNNGVVLASNLFSKELLDALAQGIIDYDALEEKEQQKFEEKKRKYNECHELLLELTQMGSTYVKLQKAFKFLSEYINDTDSTYHSFNKAYVRRPGGSGTNWADNDLEVLLKMFEYQNSSRQLAKANVFHNVNSIKGDYVDMIYKDLEAGKLVIVDQALGDSQMNKIAANRILLKIFYANSKKFSNGEAPSNVIIFVEEAHNLMPKGSEEDTTNIWARVAKEGAKYNIGMAYSTQEVSSIQRNILKNTTNWFISHLNNKEEVRALENYYDFEDFSASILAAEDKGFIRMKTRSNRFVVPIQVDKFQVRS
jgi:Helicase HerA, central domain